MTWTFSITLLLLILLFCRKPRYLLRSLGFRIHIWKYRTPFARCCIHCGRHENMYRYYGEVDIWEPILPAAHSPEKCPKDKNS